MWSLLQRLNRHLIGAIPTAMPLGFACGLWSDAGYLKNLIVPLTFLMVFPMMVALKFVSSSSVRGVVCPVDGSSLWSGSCTLGRDILISKAHRPARSATGALMGLAVAIFTHTAFEMGTTR